MRLMKNRIRFQAAIMAAAVCSAFAGFPATDLLRSFTISPSMTMKSALGGETLTEFPVRVPISEKLVQDFRYADFRKKDRSDFLFEDASGELLPFQIEWHEGDVSYAWVKLPKLGPSTVFYCRYCGSDTASPTEGVKPTEAYPAGGVAEKVHTLMTNGVNAVICSRVRYSGPGIWVFVQ